ncbi:MAG: acetyl-CoA carboxylase biotin carboxyl carrier protein subunit, partial [Candidatus Marinimicrobia bacterium]|nr:acetyl-CoA carboxylase biotin carboxyl carrier protein subunit [Candidatus Neomarinimicrobiota bacterium]
TIEKLGMQGATGGGGGQITAPIPGLISEVSVKEGDTVAAGDRLLILEAMKMENEIRAPQAGIVLAVHVALGQAVEQGALLVKLEGTPGATT